MEFGETIPLFFLTLCLLISAPLVGIIALLVIRFAFKDKQLTKNILYTILAVSLLWFVWPIGQLVYAAILICRECPGASLPSAWQLIGGTLSFSVGTLIFGIPCGFVMAFLFILPATLAVRFFRQRKGGEGKAPSA